uniref:Uncharacterized protein n=1 Tax=Vespula pensylvanica TaxID=30213 RepID=A0A834UE46_VESPE|nr:hypothetical protein H0235_002388 [Vespula pensylvanica]
MKLTQLKFISTRGYSNEWSYESKGRSRALINPCTKLRPCSTKDSFTTKCKLLHNTRRHRQRKLEQDQLPFTNLILLYPPPIPSSPNHEASNAQLKPQRPKSNQDINDLIDKVS